MKNCAVLCALIFPAFAAACGGDGSGAALEPAASGSGEPSTHFVEAPSAPSGPSVGQTFASLSFSTEGATCSRGHALSYRFEWTDGEASPWGPPSQSHTWIAPGTYAVKVQARCSELVASKWSMIHAATLVDPPAAPPGQLVPGTLTPDDSAPPLEGSPLTLMWKPPAGAAQFTGSIWIKNADRWAPLHTFQTAETSFTFAPPAADQWYAWAVAAQGPAGDFGISTYRYFFHAGNGPGLTACNRTLVDRGTLVPDALWQLVVGALTPAAAHAYRFSVTEKADYTFTFRDGAGTADFDTCLALVDDNHNLIALDDDGRDSKSGITRTLLPGTYTVCVAGFGQSAGSYALAYQRGYYRPWRIVADPELLDLIRSDGLDDVTEFTPAVLDDLRTYHHKNLPLKLTGYDYGVMAHPELRSVGALKMANPHPPGQWALCTGLSGDTLEMTTLGLGLIDSFWATATYRDVFDVVPDDVRISRLKLRSTVAHEIGHNQQPDAGGFALHHEDGAPPDQPCCMYGPDSWRGIHTYCLRHVAEFADNTFRRATQW
ncbi:MAG: PKD domain-containing protein [Planctomycetes bacterium]|nr:PKD domain-containing protein [Planctomycetota bacterium]